jgi:predicted Rossmann fold nucleotide-binding protein DprA/Smf involved in DNA uptake
VTAPAGVGRLDVARARRITKQLRESLQLSVALLREAFEGQAWRVLGHASWEDYCDAELPELATLRLPLAERREVVAGLAAGGASLRAIAKPLGLAPNTVRADLAAAGVVRDTVTSRDGRVRPAAAAAPSRRAPRVPTTDRLVAVVAAAGPDGLTVREVCQRARLPREEVSPALTRLAAAGRIAHVAPARRGQFGRWVVRIEA